MSRHANFEDNLIRNPRLISPKHEVVTITLDGPYEVLLEGPQYLFLDPDGANRTVFLPEIPPQGGLWFVIANLSSTHELNVVDSDGNALETVRADRNSIFMSSRTIWRTIIEAQEYTAAEITNVPAGDIIATTVQAAINELDTEKAAIGDTVAPTRLVGSGGGLTGGGDLSADRTLAVGAGTGIVVNADDVALDPASPMNVDHSGVSITAGAGLTGGGTLEATRDIAIGAGTGITVNADDVALTVPVTVALGGTGATTEAGARTNLGVEIGVNVQAFDADTLKADVSDNLTVGFTTTAHDLGTITTGTVTPDPANGQFQRLVNNGAFTLAAPTAAGDYSLALLITNGATAGAVTISNFEKKMNAESLATTNGNDYLIMIYVINGLQAYSIHAWQ